MPRLSRWFIRAALLYLVAGFALGAMLLALKAGFVQPGLWRLLPAHIEFMLFGWIVQLTMGVAFWILPRFGHGPARGDERIAWLAFVLLNAGALAVGIGPAIGAPSSIALAGRVAEAAAAVAFAMHAWPRVKATELEAYSPRL